MTVAQGAALGAVCAAIGIGGLVLGTSRRALPASLPVVGSAIVAPVTLPVRPAPVVMLPPTHPADVPKLPFAVRSIPFAPSSVNQFAQDKAKAADSMRRMQQMDQQRVSEGKPARNLQPTFRTDDSGNIYHLENGSWRILSNEELKNPTQQERAEATESLARAQSTDYSTDPGDRSNDFPKGSFPRN